MRNRNWFWGIFFLLSAVFVIASQVGSFVEIGLLSILASVLLVALMVSSIVERNFFGVFIPAAFLYTIYQKPLELQQVSIWLLLLAAVFCSIGLSILFHKRPKFKNCDFDRHKNHRHNFAETTENLSGNDVGAKVSFSSSSKYLHSDNLQSGQFGVSFGSLDLYFDQVQLSPEGAEVFLECSFGELKLYLPRHWRVKDQLQATLGGIENNNRFAQHAPDAPVLKLTGNVQFGNIEINYI